MSEVTCPYCSATLFDSELEAGECTSCMRRLPPHWLRTAERDGLGAAHEDAGRGWEAVRSGVVVLAVASFTLAGVLVLCACGPVASEMGRNEPMALVLVVLAALGLLVGSVLGLAGFVTTLLCPRHSGFRGLVAGTVVSLVFGVVLLVAPFLLMALLEATGNPPRWELQTLAWLMLCSGVLALVAASVVFFVYLRGIARYFGDAALGGLLLTYGILSAVLVVLNAAGLFLYEEFFRFQFGRPDMEIFMSCGFVVEGLGLLIWLGFLLRQLRVLIPRPPFGGRR
jgi:MFS family permease